ncbi:MAG: hypothetical protein AB9869_29065 [Verrucomicrobiia bacterium]
MTITITMTIAITELSLNALHDVRLEACNSVAISAGSRSAQPAMPLLPL